ncbi:dermonecrotic toxin domain-containing protein [Pseudomonas sp. H9]|uniref:dermonecrotic toxin domain-containing protein n=1 Tax=Pseudomonas sp. H9 TaxID=483968 RepID=UPI001057A431|nr:DUF6543 domain-containing protein [Pseudomonas sp. H9]TDF85002.1 hypothetical protein E1573_05005 [Pseudomonas sp. H9]
MSSHVLDLPLKDFKHAVAMQFASRPTLRQLASEKILALLVERHPVLATVQPALTDAEPLQLMVPQDTGSWSREPLVPILLQAVLDGKALNLETLHDREHGLTFPEPYRLEGSDGFEYIGLKGITDEVNELLLELPYLFQQAQLDYWGETSSVGVSRDRWLQQTLKSALLRNLPLQNLDTQQQARIYGLLRGGSQRPSVYSVEVQLTAAGESVLRILPSLLLVAEWDERTVVLWCAPSSVVKAFDSLDQFALALRDEMAEHSRFESMSWNRYELEGDVFSQQAALMLNIMLDAVEQVSASRLADVDELELLYAALADPSQWFINGYIAVSEVSAVLPPGLVAASASDSFAYQCALFELALAQAESTGESALDDVLDLHSYASQQLRAQMLADHPVDANYFSDDLLLTLTVARGNPGGAGAGVGGGVVETSTMTLTAFAIGNLSSLNGAVVTAIEHTKGQLIMDWMTVDYVKSLVEQVDIGGRYPRYVAQKLDDPDTRAQRVTRFAREWRCSLLFSALRARLGGTLTEDGLQCVYDFSHGNVDPHAPAIMLMPLAFKREPDASEADLVSGMYVLFSTDPSLVLLYRPLYPAEALTEFASLDAMMEAIGATGALQESILEWLAPEARSVYDNGGFSEPHLGRPIIDTSLLPEPVEPVSFDVQFWRIDVDVKLYMANRDLLIELADRQSVSDAESHWKLLIKGAWLLFNVATLLLRGPVATVAWLTQTIESLQADVSALTQGSAFEKSAAVVDLVMNMGLAIFHARLPRLNPPPAARLSGPPGVNDPAPLHFELLPASVVPTQGKQGLPGALAAREGMQLDFSWRAPHGLQALATEQRKSLLALRSDVSLNDVQPIESGSTRGLYTVEGVHYAKLAGDVYRVEVSELGTRVVDANGTFGPWLQFQQGQWRIDAGLRLLGGGPKRRAEQTRKDNQKEFDEYHRQQSSLVAERNGIADGFQLSRTLWGEREEHVVKLRVQREKALGNPASTALIEAFDKKIELAEKDVLSSKLQAMEDLKALIKVNLKLDNVLSDMVQPKFARQELSVIVKAERSSVRQETIDNCVAFYNETAQTVRQINVQKLIDDMVAKPVGEAELKQYDYVHSLVESSVRLRFDLVWTSKNLDTLLADTLKDVEITFETRPGEIHQSKHAQLNHLIEQRNLTQNDLQLGLLDDLAELSMNRRAAVDEEILLQNHDKLWNSELTSAGSSHGELAVLDLPVGDQINVLTSTLKEYQSAQSHAAYLSETGGEAISAEPLKQYQEVLNSMILSAEEDLAVAIRASELSDTVPTKTRLYERRKGKHRVVQTGKGRSIIGEEVEVNGVNVVQQKDPNSDKVLKTFSQQDDVWVEQVEEPSEEVPLVPNSRDVGTARANAKAKLGQVESILKLAKQYIGSNEPIGMQSVIEGHVDQLKAAASALDSTGIASEFGTQVSDAIQRLEDTQVELLSSYYLTTSHPTAAGLRYLFKEKKIAIARTVTRKQLADDDYLDVYEVKRLPSRDNEKGTSIWEAHFHYRDTQVPGRQFAKGHLKIWSQRLMGRRTMMEAVRSNSRELVQVYRGNLVLSDVEGVIPFD